MSTQTPNTGAPAGMPAFTTIWAGQFASLIGSSLSSFAIGIWLYQETGLATTLTTLIFFANIPRIVVSPFAGALVDRWDRKATMMISDLAAACATVVIFLLIRGGSLEIWHLYLLAALSSAFEAFQFPAYSSAITLLVEKKHFARTSAMLALAEDASRVLAPILAAALIGTIRLEGIILLDLATFVVAITTLVLVPIPRPRASATGQKSGQGLLRETVYGFRFMLANPALLGLQVNFLIVNLMLGLSTVLRTPMVLARTGNNEAILGIVSSSMATGGVVGGLLMSIWGGPRRRIHGVLVGLMLIAVGRAVLGLGQEVIAWSIGGFLIMFFIAVSNASNQAIWQAKTPPDVQGRVFSARRLSGQLTFPLAVLVAGPLADQWFEPAMAPGGSLATLFGGLVGVGPGAGMSALILLTAVVGILPPIASYGLRALRQVEDLVPDSLPLPAEAEPGPSPA